MEDVVTEEEKDYVSELVYKESGITLAKERICEGHRSLLEYFTYIYLKQPSLTLLHGPRGGGKSYLSALHTDMMSRKYAKHGTRILGGSKAQSEQVYRALREITQARQDRDKDDPAGIAKFLKNEAIYKNGSDVAILAASSKSVRGPHVPSLKLDEVDEIDRECREAAMGMCMARKGAPASILMTSTWHRTNGPMAELIERANQNDFMLFTFCTFEVLERCPPERSGERTPGTYQYEKCPKCPLFSYCCDARDEKEPKAKRSDGHYTIDSLIQKLRATSKRTFESDYLCKGPRSDGLWFPGFGEATHVSLRAEFDPALPVHLAIDSGVFTGAVFFQVGRDYSSPGSSEEIHVFAEYLAENLTAEQNARAIREVARLRCHDRTDTISTDPAGGSRNPVGPTVIGEYERVGLRPLRRWPHGSVADGLALVESFAQSAEGRSGLIVHPRCVATIRAMQNYRRAKRGGQWQDYPEDPQHPHEELVDSLRGGLRDRFPEGRAPQPTFARVSARQVF